MFQNHIVIENWNEEINILHLISKAYQNRDLKQLIELITTISFFNDISNDDFLHLYHDIFFKDPIMKFHINYLQNDLMEKNFLKIIEPYSVVEIQFIAKKMELSESEVIHSIVE